MSDSQDDDGGATFVAIGFLFFVSVVVCGFGYCYYQRWRKRSGSDEQKEGTPKKNTKKYTQLTDMGETGSDDDPGPAEGYVAQPLAPVAQPPTPSVAPDIAHPPRPPLPQPTGARHIKTTRPQSTAQPARPAAANIDDLEGESTDEEDTRIAGRKAHKAKEEEAFFPGDEEESSSSSGGGSEED